jgi:hypothetical protein
MIYNHSNNDWIYTHRMVANFMKENNLYETFTHKINENNLQIIHHKDFNRYNNNPENLCFMNSKDHILCHRDMAKEMYNSYSNETKLSHINLRKKGFYSYWNSLTDVELNIKKNTVIKNSLNSRNKSSKTFTNNPNRKEIIEKRRIKSIKTKNMPEHKKICSNNAKKQWENTNLREIVKEKQSINYSEKLLDLLFEYYDEYHRIDLILDNKINIKNSEWLNEFNQLNPNNKQLKKMTEITRNNIDKMLKYFGYSNWNDFKRKVPYYNHRITSIEWLTKKQDTGTITIDSQEQLHDYHTFALSCGIFTRNSNLNDIHDIEYLRDNLFVGLGVPKPFLSFQDAAGGGKNLAQYDIRFSKKINRIQQSMIQELNKMAMIHLYLLGYTGEDLNNFQITLTNPSTQQELLKSELMRDKAQTYGELTRAEAGIAAMSHTQAKRMIFNMSDKEIVDDLKQQKMEKVVMQELQDSPVTIKKSGLFTDIDKRFGEPLEDMQMTGGTGEKMPPEGGAPIGGAPPAGGEDLGGLPPAPAGGDMGELPPAPAAGGAPMMENKGLSDEEYEYHIERLVYGKNNKPDEIKGIERDIIQENSNKNNTLNKSADEMINEIDSLLENSKSINKPEKEDELDDIDIEDIEKIDFNQ